jgi:RNA polymerase sigma-70 factor (ECF subfamily)
MLAVAFRTLRNTAEAEDIVQDVWLRWQNVDHDEIRNASAFLTTTTLRLAINRATDARARRETPLDAWLGEPVDPQAGPGILAERGQELEAALLRLLERLTPVERAAYLLREAFNYDYRSIASVVGVSEASSRQLVTRARKHLADDRRLPVNPNELRRIAIALLAATQKGDLVRLEAVLSREIVARFPAKGIHVGARSKRNVCVSRRV